MHFLISLLWSMSPDIRASLWRCYMGEARFRALWAPAARSGHVSCLIGATPRCITFLLCTIAACIRRLTHCDYASRCLRSRRRSHLVSSLCTGSIPSFLCDFSRSSFSLAFRPLDRHRSVARSSRLSQFDRRIQGTAIHPSFFSLSRCPIGYHSA